MKNKGAILIVILMMISFSANCALGASFVLPNKVTIGVGQAEKPVDIINSLQLIFFLTVLSLAPSLLIMTTCFTRIIIVLSFVRHALSLQQIPPNQVMIGLALFLTFFVMAPTWGKINDQALQPYLQGKISQELAWTITVEEVQGFMLKHTRKKDLALFVQMANIPRPKEEKDIPIRHLLSVN